MNTDAVRARNARKRAKLKAHKRGISVPSMHEDTYVFEFGAKGIKAGFPDDAEDFSPGDPYLPDWALYEDFIEVYVEGPKALYDHLDDLKWDVKEFVEEQYGFNMWDMQVLLMNVYKRP